MARLPELEQFAAKHGLMLLSVADMIAYRLQREHIVKCTGTGTVRPGWLGPGEPFIAHYYESEVDDTEYLALVRGDVTGDLPILVRVAAMDPLCDPFQLRPDLVSAMKAIDDAGRGVFLWVFNRNRTRLKSAFERTVLQREVSRTTVGTGASEALRDFGLGAQVLADLGCHKVRLMMWSDRKIPGIEGFGIDVVERVPIPPPGAVRAGKTA
jgi:3,4-dihydroxy 2-butanone 4-phosphate synthase/GTP cyclohydrolase II